MTTPTTDDLPPLPGHLGFADVVRAAGPVYTADQMREYARAAIEQAAVPEGLPQAVLTLNAAWNRKEPEEAIAGHLDLCRRLAVSTDQSATVSVMGMTIEEAKLLDATIEGFCDCGETDTPYEKLLDWANRGYLECERFVPLPAAQDVIDAARLANKGGAA